MRTIPGTTAVVAAVGIAPDLTTRLRADDLVLEAKLDG